MRNKKPSQTQFNSHYILYLISDGNAALDSGWTHYWELGILLRLMRDTFWLYKGHIKPVKSVHQIPNYEHSLKALCRFPLTSEMEKVNQVQALGLPPHFHQVPQLNFSKEHWGEWEIFFFTISKIIEKAALLIPGHVTVPKRITKVCFQRESCSRIKQYDTLNRNDLEKHGWQYTRSTFRTQKSK